MFEITGAEIAELNDADLRTLVARLCEADLRQAGLPVSAVTAGGDQDAADGGLDVRVDLPSSAILSGFIPRPATGYQVKVPDMPRRAILKEMRPKGRLRPVIQELASMNGAYIIVSSNGSTADIILQRRRKAMREAVATGCDAEALVLDFYDRERLASWVRDHPGLIPWVREKIGQPITGWGSYANWASPGESLDAEYLLDEKSRLHDWQSLQEGPLSIEKGMRRIREALALPKRAVRLIGHSGMGKTRLVQALFDERIGYQALDPALAVYTNMADQPEPSPRELVRRFVQNRQRAIFVVDNCPPETHRALAMICNEPESTLSLITVEFDVGDDDPEGTEVFRLEPASDDIIKQLLECKTPQLSQVDRRRIAEFSGGNARIALVLAHTVRRGESIANLADKVLFERLFRQGRPQDEGLLRAAEICSLVYSFNGEALEGEAAELPFLAELAGFTMDQLYRYVAELHSRDLVQRRSQWRAVLPPAVAIRLARQALAGMPPEKTASSFLKKASARLLKSFSRRLGYLHDCEAAQGIVKSWLSNGGALSDLPRLTPLDIDMFRNVAPVAPDAVLEVIERAASGENSDAFFDVSSPGRRSVISLLRSIAFDANLFQRATLLLSRFVMAEPPDHNSDSARGPFLNLFQLLLSGTHASINQRLQVIDSLIGNEDARSQSCGLDALDALLKSYHFSSSYSFDFGARPRDYGWHPTTNDDTAAWYKVSIEYARRVALSHGPSCAKARSILAGNFRDLWAVVGAVDELESMASAIAAECFWSEGWIAVCDTIRHVKGMSPDLADRLRALEAILRPDDLLQTARVYTFSATWDAIGIGDEKTREESESASSVHRFAFEMAERLGREIATKPDVLSLLLPDLVRGDLGRRRQFGHGLAVGAENLPEMWQTLVNALAGTPENERNTEVFYGFIRGAASLDAKAHHLLLDAAVDDSILGPWFPILQTSIDIDKRGVKRLEAALNLGLAPIWTYVHLCNTTDAIPTNTLRRLILKIASLPDGYNVAANILKMRLYSVTESGPAIDRNLVQCGRELVKQFTIEHSGEMPDGDLGEIVKACFKGKDAAKDTIIVCRRLKAGLSEYRFHRHHCIRLLAGLFGTQPLITLDEFLGDRPFNTRYNPMMAFGSGRWNPLDEVPTDVLVDWANVDPKTRFPLLASAITPLTKDDDKSEPVWSPMAMQILNLAPDRVAVLDGLSSHISPSGGWGSHADELERRRALLRVLISDADDKVVAWARAKDVELVRMIEQKRHCERREDESFE